MRILSLKPGHDGSIALIEGSVLVFSLEAEKDSFERYSEISPTLFALATESVAAIPDVVAIGGWEKGRSPENHTVDIAAGYNGLDNVIVEGGSFFGVPVKRFSSSHERSHIFGVAAMAPFAPIPECVVLVWEGNIGAFYHWTDFGAQIERIHVLSQPGARYGALFALCDPSFPDSGLGPRHQDSGKLMALAAFGEKEKLTASEKDAVDRLFGQEYFWPFDKASRRETPLYNCGVGSLPMKRAARYLTDKLYEVFYQAAVSSCPRDVPLLISGGCGLNCEWNRKWSECGLFTQVFVPPCANDSGSAIGTAVDAMVHLGGECRLDWNVYSGADFKQDVVVDSGVWSQQPLDTNAIAQCLMNGAIVAWVEGRCEIGPRALGHRSLLASPHGTRGRDLLNKIKGRGDYRPIAPVCIRNDLHQWFESPIDDPYMLYISKVKTDALHSITHVDGTARVQSVGCDDNPRLYRLLEAFRKVSGYSVLCNTSLNFKGRGFINSMSDLIGFCSQADIGEAVVNGVWYRRLYHP